VTYSSNTQFSHPVNWHGPNIQFSYTMNATVQTFNIYTVNNQVCIFNSALRCSITDYERECKNSPAIWLYDIIYKNISRLWCWTEWNDFIILTFTAVQVLLNSAVQRTTYFWTWYAEVHVSTIITSEIIHHFPSSCRWLQVHKLSQDKWIKN